MKKPAAWTQELIDEYLPKFAELNGTAKGEAGMALSEEIVERLRQHREAKGLKWSSLKKPLSEVRAALESSGYELLTTFSTEEWDAIAGKTEAEKRQAWREEQLVEESLLSELTQVLSEQEIELVNQARQKSGLTLSELVKRGIVAEAKTQISKIENAPCFDGMTIEEVAASDSKEASQEMARRAIDAIVDHNDGATEKGQKWYISQGFVSSFLKARLAANVHQATVKKVIEAQAIRIQDHNQKHGLRPLDNRKGANSPWTIDEIEI